MDIDKNIPLFEPHAQNGKRFVTDEERIVNDRASSRRTQAERRKNPGIYAAMKQYQYDKYHANLEESRQYVRDKAKRFRTYNPEKVKEWARNTRERLGKDGVKNRDLQRNYGITLEEWTALFELQGKCCAICKCGDAKKWNTDHNHSTGKVRGILCTNCNFAIGCFRENATVLFNAIEYLKR